MYIGQVKELNAELEKDVYNILLLGTDADNPESDGGRGHNDTNMIMQIDRVNKTMKLVSFMRDMIVTIHITIFVFLGICCLVIPDCIYERMAEHGSDKGKTKSCNDQSFCLRPYANADSRNSNTHSREPRIPRCFGSFIMK